jgi:cyclomaltodextrinase / maltogenic alpha-amylase / neopullulanase
MNRFVPFLLLALAAAGMAGCKNNNDVKISDDPEIRGIAQTIVLQTDTTTITLSDLFRHPKPVDSIRMDKSLGYQFSPDSLVLSVYPKEKNLPRLSVITFFKGGYEYSFLAERSRKIWVHYSFDPKNKKYKKVQLAGEMNDWNPAKTPLKLKDNKWETDLLLYPGKFQYQVVVDGKWMLDPGNKESMDNNIGGYNSVLRAGSVNPAGAPVLFTKSYDSKEIVVGGKNKMKEFFVFWQNIQLDPKFFREDSSGITVTIPRKARDLDRSFLRIRAWNNSGTSNEILVPLDKGRVMADAAKLTRSDFHAMIMYFMMVDRFKDGDTTNDKKVVDPDLDPKVNYFGGDLAGITQKIEDNYFTDLGVNTLWISPITQNPYTAWREYPKPHRKFSGYHGYWPMTLATIDNRFGSPAVLKKMVSEAHDKNISVVLDYVSNHVHKDSWLYKAHPDWATPFDLPGKRKNIRLWDEQRLTTWFDDFLPTLDLSREEICNMVSDSALYLIKEYDLDGFRHDATKHIPEIYWRTLTKKIHEEVTHADNRPVYQIGETYGSRELIKSYINPGMLDGQFDFDVYFTGRSVFCKENEPFTNLNDALQQSFSFYGNHALMGYITGNQDQSRFISLASGALKFGEDDHEAGWKRDVGVDDTIGYSRLASMIAFNMTIPGIPVIYYGDEFGMPGANDPDNRRMMKFDNLNPQEARLKALTQKLVHLRRSSLALIYGDFRTVEVTEKSFIYMRSYFDRVVFVVFNKDAKAKKLDFVLPERFEKAKLTSMLGTAVTVKDNKVSLEVKENSFEIIMN